MLPLSRIKMQLADVGADAMKSKSNPGSLFGYHGNYLRVDLTKETAETRPIDPTILRSFIGGSGLGAHLMLSEGQASIEPFSPASGLAFIFSPLVGSAITTSAKFAIACKSPLTNRFNDAMVSSRFAIAGKRTGSDAIFVVGQAKTQSILLIDNGMIRLEPAGDLAGANSNETEERLRERFGNEFQFAVIGKAGENKVRYATISHDGRHAGRGGTGAVLGAKNLKAVGVKGVNRVEWADAKRLVELAGQLSAKSLGPATEKYRELGTATNLLVFNRLNALPTRNFQQGNFDGAEQIAPESLTQTRAKTRKYCASCTIGCEHLYELKSSEKSVRVEYENLFALGPLCGISDPNVVLQANQMCDEFGIDTISAGGSIAFAMECAERGLIDESWLRFGDGEAVLQAIEMIANRNGFGNLLAEGSRRMAEEFGNDSIQFTAQVKGLELPGYDPRALQTMALGFAVNTRGADHNRSGAYEVDFSSESDRFAPDLESVKKAIETEDRSALMDSLIICKFLRGAIEDLFEESANILRCITGWDVTSAELRSSTSKIVDCKKKFNIQAGWTPAEDMLPRRFFESNERDGGPSIDERRFKDLIRAYNHQRGWTDEGWLCEQSLNDDV